MVLYGSTRCRRPARRLSAPLSQSIIPLTYCCVEIANFRIAHCPTHTALFTPRCLMHTSGANFGAWCTTMVNDNFSPVDAGTRRIRKAPLRRLGVYILQYIRPIRDWPRGRARARLRSSGARFRGRGKYHGRPGHQQHGGIAALERGISWFLCPPPSCSERAEPMPSMLLLRVFCLVTNWRG
jgi:hypothetical protein